MNMWLLFIIQYKLHFLFIGTVLNDLIYLFKLWHSASLPEYSKLQHTIQVHIYTTKLNAYNIQYNYIKTNGSELQPMKVDY